jgi:hypothetical protein
VLGGLNPETQLAEAERAAGVVEQSEGADAACDFVVSLAAKLILHNDTTTGWHLAALARRWLRAERCDRTWIMLRAWELDEQDFADPDQPGIPLDTPERKELHVAAARLAVVVPSPGFGPASVPEALKFAEIAKKHGDEEVTARLIGWWLGTGGRYREAAIENQRHLDDYLHRGRVAPAVSASAMAARFLTVLGDHDDAQARLAQGMELLPRVPPQSNSALQLLGALSLRGLVCGTVPTVDDLEQFQQFGAAADTRWAALAIRLSVAEVRAYHGDAAGALAILRQALPAIERAPVSAVNYPLVLATATGTLWWSQRIDHLDVLERHVRDKWLPSGLHYPETDVRWVLARLCALDGRINEARGWCAKARQMMTSLGTTPLLVAVDHDEALMEIRRGAESDRARVAELIKSARAGCTHPSMHPWLARLDQLKRSAAE